MTDIPRAYESADVEKKWYAFWEESGFFHADVHSSKPPYCIVIPPPNVTGSLHMGHALPNTLQDILIRWKRMSGYEALWVPGTDHAGIATQTVVERHLLKTLGKTRKEMSREEFLAQVWAWKEKHEKHIVSQLKRLGCSCDWQRQRFTMDQESNRAVRVMFKKMFDAKLIYRGDYLVNWDPVAQTALADDEVEYEERESFLWYFRYPLLDSDESIVVATTRPETMLGDTAIAVSSKDERYRHLLGKQALLPLVNRPIPIIADHLVDPTFGSGAVKVTPAHDPKDYEVALRHHLPVINILKPDGRINEQGGEFAGLPREEAREAVVARMKAAGLLVKIEPYSLRVGVSYRSKAIIEPYLSKQWFVRMDHFRPLLRDAVEKGQVRLLPPMWNNTYFHWIDNLRDWCISRQLWWGHRIPVWYRRDDDSKMLCYEGEGLPEEVQANPELWRQDEDVLDTWFSAGLWPFSTLGWPDHTEELARFYPNAVLVTGYDILFFWVARMILMGNYALNQAPFPEAFLSGLIFGKSYWRLNPEGGVGYVTGQERDEYDRGKPTPSDVFSKWEKMSKSKGNIIDPVEVIDEYGTDAVRMALSSCATQGRQIDLDRRRFEEFKNFANKVWNGARFVFFQLTEEPSAERTALTGDLLSQGLDREALRLEDKWLLIRLNRAVEEVNSALTSYAFDRAAAKAYDFYWNEFCAYYLEIAKPVLSGKQGSSADRSNKQKLLAIALCYALRLLHPMAPYITEELFQRMKAALDPVSLLPEADPFTQEVVTALQSRACVVAPYPQHVEDEVDPSLEASFDALCRIVHAIRNIRGEMQLPPSTATEVIVVGPKESAAFQRLTQNSSLIQALVRLSALELTSEERHWPFAGTAIVDDLKVIVPLPKELLAKEKLRLQKEQEKLQASIARLQAQLANEQFLAKAPANLVEQQRKQLEEWQRQASLLSAKLDN